MHHKLPGFATAVLLLALPILCDPAIAQGRRMEGELTVTPVRGSVYLMVMEPAGNLGVSVGEDGGVLVWNIFFDELVPELQQAQAPSAAAPAPPE